MEIKVGQILKVTATDRVILGIVKERLGGLFDSGFFGVGVDSFFTMSSTQYLEDCDGSGLGVIAENGSPIMGVVIEEASKHEKFLFYMQGSECLSV